MAWTCAETSVTHSFVDVCDVLIHQPDVLLPEPHDQIGRAEWRITMTTSRRRRRRAPEWLAFVDELTVKDAAHASVSARWCSARQRARRHPRRATLSIDALSGNPSPRTALILAIEQPAAHTAVMFPSLRRRRVSDVVQIEVHQIANRIADLLAPSVDRSTWKNDLPSPYEASENDNTSKSENP